MRILLLLLQNILVFCQFLQTIKVGLMFSKDTASVIRSVGYRTSAAAVLVAKDRIRAEHLLDQYDFKWVLFSEISLIFNSVNISYKTIEFPAKILYKKNSNFP